MIAFIDRRFPSQGSSRRFAPFVILIALGSCGPRQEPPPSPYSSVVAPIEFSVAQIEFSNPSTLPNDANFIDRRRSNELAEQATELLQQRLRAGGGEGLARVELRQASMIERPRPTQSGIQGFFTREASSEIDADLQVVITIVDALGLEQAFAEINVGRTRPILEGTNTVGRDADARITTYGVLNQLDEALEQAVAENLQPYVLGF